VLLALTDALSYACSQRLISEATVKPAIGHKVVGGTRDSAQA